MKHAAALAVRFALLALVLVIWWWAVDARLSAGANLAIIAGAEVLVLPVVWWGKTMLDRRPTSDRVAWTTTFVHYGVGFLFGLAIIRAMVTHSDWSGWTIPLPAEVGLALVIITGAATFLTVANLAMKGLGAPFAIALSRKLAVDWFYAWTRNPMVLAALALLLSLGLWFQSALFLVWVLVLFAPALLVFVKVYEERELELRFGASYLGYRARTPMLFPRRPKA